MKNLAKSPLVFPFLVMLAMFLMAYLNHTSVLNYTSGEIAQKIAFTILVIDIWVIGLCLHEFSHAFSSYLFGDKSVVGKGYLSLNPLLYGDIGMSLVWPVLILLIGGLPLPGGAVYLNHGQINSKIKVAITYICGPLANLVFGVALGIIYFLIKDIPHSPLIPAAFAMSVYLQFYTFIFNILPLPGFDGFGFIATFLSPEFRNKMMRYAAIVMIALFLSIFIFPRVFMYLQMPAYIGMISMGFGMNDLSEGFSNFMGGH